MNRLMNCHFVPPLPRNNVNSLGHEKVSLHNKKTRKTVCGLFQLFICVAQSLDWA